MSIYGIPPEQVVGSSGWLKYELHERGKLESAESNDVAAIAVDRPKQFTDCARLRD